MTAAARHYKCMTVESLVPPFVGSYLIVHLSDRRM